MLVLALSLGLACVGFLPFNLRPGRHARRVHGRLRAARCSGSCSRSLGLAASWTVAGTTVATILLPLLVLAIPILDTTLVTVARLVERRPVTQGGTDHTSHRLVYYGLSERKAVLCSRSSPSRSARPASPTTCSTTAASPRSACSSRSSCSSSSGASSRDLEERSRRGRGSRAVPLRARSCSSRADSSRSSSTSCSSAPRSSPRTCSSSADSATPVERAAFLAALPVVLATRYVLLRPRRDLPARVALRDDDRRARDRGRPVRLGSALVAWIVVDLIRGSTGFPSSVFVLDAIFCTVLVGGDTARLPRLRRGRRTTGPGRPSASRVLIVGAGRARSQLRPRGRARHPARASSASSTTTRRSAGVGSAAQRVLGPQRASSASSRRATPTEVVVTIADAPRDRLDR